MGCWLIARDYETQAGTGEVRTEGNSYELYQGIVRAHRGRCDLSQQLSNPADTDGATRKEIVPRQDSGDWRSMACCRGWRVDRTPHGTRCVGSVTAGGHCRMGHRRLQAGRGHLSTASGLGEGKGWNRPSRIVVVIVRPVTWTVLGL